MNKELIEFQPWLHWTDCNEEPTRSLLEKFLKLCLD